jgi:hypothetical protein
MVSGAWFDLGKLGVVLPTRGRDLLVCVWDFPNLLKQRTIVDMKEQERRQTSEYQQGLWRASQDLERLVDALYEAGKMGSTYTGFVSVMTRSGEDLLVVQELEPHVLVRLAYSAAGRRQGSDPDVELFSYIDRHGAYFPILLRGHLVRRAAQAAHQTALVAFADHVVHHLVREGWPEQGVPIDQVEWGPLVATELQVTMEEKQRLARWLAAQGMCEATDGCYVRPHERCPHGEPSWFVALGLI